MIGVFQEKCKRIFVKEAMEIRDEYGFIRKIASILCLQRAQLISKWISFSTLPQMLQEWLLICTGMSRYVVMSNKQISTCERFTILWLIELENLVAFLQYPYHIYWPVHSLAWSLNKG